MAELPPIVFIARHGARLDAADKDWHLTSPTPYDPPLSYGGWIQARALGTRIASLLRASELTGKDSVGDRAQSATSETPVHLPSPPASSELCNRYNIVIHTSPFLRCLQTAIGVSAGLSQSRLEPPEIAVESAHKDTRPLLRVDAFLGEWLSPDYFDQIVPPPASDRMIALAKAELLRRSEGIPVTREGTRSLSGHFPGGWSSSQSNPTSPHDEDDRRAPSRGSSTITATIMGGQAQRQRASTYDNLQSPTDISTGRISNGPKALGRLNTDLPAMADTAYVPPTPGYAVSPSDPIPAGYVAHARDACTNIDYQWDSMRTPFWGTGGEYGEEWSSMHERVRQGFRQMVDWYQQENWATRDRSRRLSNGAPRKEDFAQTVLVIITHGADCNAMITSLAGHSVLLDIGTASLTMAVRRDRVTSSPLESDRNDRSLSLDYALQLVASSDHLRAGVDPSQLPLLTSLSSASASQSLPPPIPFYRNRLGSRPSASRPILQGSFTLGPTAAVGPNSHGWSLAPRSSTSTTTPRGASGLWNSIASPIEKNPDENDDDLDDFVPNFGDRPVSHGSNHASPTLDRSGWIKQSPQRTLSQRGLWGSAPTLDDRDGTSRRRWTVAEQKL
ncbi:hypothetical protein N7462_008201 [Penicillium macrosclerotiorum]|uniref:uncharacterized protein n=1 Tax=Penicillium macrosclerotiorum TaxID=303699 RepID=UPI0025473A57|nr:uncharacterized protein N7462_008201 [Penicillium macrosclerotiorum]KAJ5679957.1 hypothetical protein N7462_008201 [Penicillium macrosclerotiorum]